VQKGEKKKGGGGKEEREGVGGEGGKIEPSIHF
jgi:hypothetical protein